MVMDTWLVSPVRCDHIYDPELVNVGIGHTEGQWVVLLGNAEKQSTTKKKTKGTRKGGGKPRPRKPLR